MLSGEPALPRSKVMVVEFVSCARTTREPMSGPPPSVLTAASTNVRLTSTAAGSVAVVDSVAPVIVVTEPRCTLMSAAFVNSTTCHETMWLATPVVLNCRLVVVVRSPAMVSSLPCSFAVAADVIDHSTNAWFMELTAVIGTLTVAADNVDSPRWTVTPEPNVATYHWMLIGERRTFVRDPLELDGRGRCEPASQQGIDGTVAAAARLEDQERLAGVDRGDRDRLDAVRVVDGRAALHLLNDGRLRDRGHGAHQDEREERQHHAGRGAAHAAVAVRTAAASRTRPVPAPGKARPARRRSPTRHREAGAARIHGCRRRRGRGDAR